MKRSEVLDYAMRGVIELMRQEQNEKVNAELNQALKELAMMFVLAEREENEQGYLSYLRKGPLKRPLGGLYAIHSKTTKCQKLTFSKKFVIIYM